MPLPARRPRSPVRGRTLAGLATGGIVIGHLLGYLTAFPNAAKRQQHLAAIGRGSFHLPGLTALALTGISLVALGCRPCAASVPFRREEPRSGWAV